MKIGTIDTEGTGITNGHPPVIIAGKIKEGTACGINGLLSLDKNTGEFETYNFASPSGAACVALDSNDANQAKAVKVLLHGTFDGTAVVKADGNSLTAAELAAVQANSQIYFV